MVANFANWLGGFFQNLFNVSLKFISDLFGSLISGLITVLKYLFSPLLALVAIVFYLLYKLGELIILLLSVLLALGKLLYSFVIGLFKTLAGLVWMPTTPNHGRWSSPIIEAFKILEEFQLNKIAYVISFFVWLFTAYGAIKILSGRGENP